MNIYYHRSPERFLLYDFTTGFVVRQLLFEFTVASNLKTAVFPFEGSFRHKLSWFAVITINMILVFIRTD